jgi:hypothetical protein
MPTIRLLHWQSNSICLLPEPVTERRPSSRPCSKFATHPVQSRRNAKAAKRLLRKLLKK